MQPELRTVTTETLEIGYFESGQSDGVPVVLMHGFPYDPHAYDVVADVLSDHAYRVIVPFMRGYGPTRFRDPDRVRSGEQAAFGDDLVAFMDALELPLPILAGYDWGGRAACVVSAVWPERVRGLVSVTGYNIFGPPELAPRDPQTEHLYWYQYYLGTHRGRQMLTERRRDFCRHLWEDWSPNWDFDDATFELSARSFDNPDFVEVVLHSYRHRLGQVAGDPALRQLAVRTEAMPPISVPTVVLHGDADFQPPAWSEDASPFTGPYERRVVPGAGHNLPQENPGAMVDAIERVIQMTSPASH
jgi:pimeloyl-ACP methyl ester carboxylesterase